jgi:hypothetical protein
VTRRTRRAYLIGNAILAALGAIAFLASPGLARDPAPPGDVPGMARWLLAHPGDWLTASALVDGSLDAAVPRRVELWHASYALADHLAPRRPNPHAAFVRAGLFHWYELGTRDRQQVLAVTAPLLHDSRFFGNVYLSLFDLTRDFGYLRRNAPETQEVLAWLSDLAVTNGLFAEYRELREARRAERWRVFQSVRSTEHGAEIVDLLPSPLDSRDEPLVRSILEELDQRPFDPQHVSRRSEELTLYAIRHGLQPLGALAPLIDTEGALSRPTRARLALALGDAGRASKVEISSSVTATPEWRSYELERALFEARDGNRSIAEAYLARAALIGVDARVLFTAEEIATIEGDAKAAARYRAQLAEAARKPRQWTETCGANELCDRAEARQSVADNGTIRVEAAVVQSDQVPPYLEIYVDDARVAEGEVRDRRVFEAPATPGVHRVEVRLVNRFTRNGIRRRVRLS